MGSVCHNKQQAKLLKKRILLSISARLQVTYICWRSSVKSRHMWEVHFAQQHETASWENWNEAQQLRRYKTWDYSANPRHHLLKQPLQQTFITNNIMQQRHKPTSHSEIITTTKLVFHTCVPYIFLSLLSGVGDNFSHWWYWKWKLIHQGGCLHQIQS